MDARKVISHSNECVRQVANLHTAGFHLHAAATIHKTFDRYEDSLHVFKELEQFIHKTAIEDLQQLVHVLYGEP